MSKKDIFSRQKRSDIMASIRSKDTKIELLLNKELRKEGLNYERHGALPGTPDFVFPKERLAVFCHGDFWHGLNYGRMKAKLNAYWRNKIETNMKRDRRVASKLTRMGWRTMTLRGSKISKDVNSCVCAIKRRLA